MSATHPPDAAVDPLTANLTCWSPGGHPVPTSTVGARVPHWRTVPPTPVRERLVVVAPRPGDETLAAGGLMLWCAHHGVEVVIAALTDGESFAPSGGPGSPRRTRVSERDAALAILGARATVRRFGMTEAAICWRRDEVVARLVPLLDEATVCVAPWRLDGSMAHEAAGRAAATAAGQTGAASWEAPVWGRLDGRFGLAPAGRLACALDLGPVLRARKQAAVASFREPLPPRGAETIHTAVTGARAVQALTTSVEWFFSA